MGATMTDDQNEQQIEDADQKREQQNLDEEWSEPEQPQGQDPRPPRGPPTPVGPQITLAPDGDEDQDVLTDAPRSRSRCSCALRQSPRRGAPRARRSTSP